MLFNSYIFVLLFLPLSVIIYFLLNHFNLYKCGTAFLCLASVLFYAYAGLNTLPLIIISILFNYGTVKLFDVITSKKLRKTILSVAIILNVAVLVYFKYSNFIVDNINNLFNSNFIFKNLILPLGISFFTFQQIAYLVDSYKNEIENKNFIDYALLILYFPKLIAGPIVSSNDMFKQIQDTNRKNVNWDNLAKGFHLFVLGMAKKVLIADVFGSAVNIGFSDVGVLNSIEAIFIMLAYTVQIYFDFSGYSDMAIGVSCMLNIDLPVNFNSPYKALTITEFWSRWHITLTGFFTKYIYIPLGGSRKGKIRTYVNTMIVFLISGLWHGANWTFILWGALHGIFMCITKLFKNVFEKFHPVFNWFLTFGFVNFAWVLFRANSISDAGLFFRRILSFDFADIGSGISQAFKIIELEIPFSNIFNGDIPQLIWLLMYSVLAFLLILGFRNAKEHTDTFKPTLIKGIVTAVLLVLCIFSFSGMNTFLYANF